MEVARGLALPELAQLFGVDALPNYMAAVERRLAQSLQPFHSVLTPAGLASVSAPGKRLRPLLTVLSAQVGDVFDQRVIDAAVAVELIQIGSLVHDDLVEGAQTRRGAPTVNGADGLGVAVVTGDLVFAKAAMLVAALGSDPAQILSEGLLDMATGQMRELQQLHDVARTEKQTTDVAAAKTGALFACACRLGAWSAGLATKQRDALTRYGLSFGVGFQILDDLLDLVGDPDRMGKPVGADLAAGVYTLPTVLALQQRGSKTLAKLLRRDDAIAEARARIGKSKAVDEAMAAVDLWMGKATRAARQLPDAPTTAGLEAFPQTYLRWALAQFT